MRGAIIGLGTIAMGHIAGYSHLSDLSVEVAVDPSPARRKVAEATFGMRAYATFGEMLHRESPQFIDVCSPPDTHNDYLLAAVSNDLHVLCEKPVFMPDGRGYAPLLAAIERADTIVYPCHNYKFAPILGLLEKVVKAPDFGEVIAARFRTLRSGHARGVPEWHPHWRRDRKISGGGIIRDHGPHSVYLARHLTGREPLAVSCVAGNLRADRYTETEDTALITVRCEGGVQFVLDLSWAAGYRNSFYSVSGSSGNVIVENDDVVYTLNGKVHHETLASDFDDPSHKEWFRLMLADFARRVDDPTHQPELIREALITSLVLDAAYESAASEGAWVDVRSPDRMVVG